MSNLNISQKIDLITDQGFKVFLIISVVIRTLVRI